MPRTVLPVSGQVWLPLPGTSDEGDRARAGRSYAACGMPNVTTSRVMPRAMLHLRIFICSKGVPPARGSKLPGRGVLQGRLGYREGDQRPGDERLLALVVCEDF